MNIWRIAFFLILMNGAFIVIGAAQIPIKCDAAETSCVYFDNDLIGSTTLPDILADNIADKSYKAVQIEEEVAADIYTATATALSKLGEYVVFTIAFVYAMTIFIFGVNPVSIAVGILLQSAIYLFILRSVISIIKEGKGDM